MGGKGQARRGHLEGGEGAGLRRVGPIAGQQSPRPEKPGWRTLGGGVGPGECEERSGRRCCGGSGSCTEGALCHSCDMGGKNKKHKAPGAAAVRAAVSASRAKSAEAGAPGEAPNKKPVARPPPAAAAGTREPRVKQGTSSPRAARGLSTPSGCRCFRRRSQRDLGRP